MKNISLTGKVRKKTLLPKLYFLVFTSKGEYMTHWGVYHSLEEARKESVSTFSPNKVWTIHSEIMLSPSKIENMFKENGNRVMHQKEREKNMLIKRIIDKKDFALLKESKGSFNKKEIAYINGRL